MIYACDGKWRTFFNHWNTLPRYDVDAIEIDSCSYARTTDEGGKVYPVSSYGAIFSDANVPDPVKLAEFLNEFCHRLICGTLDDAVRDAWWHCLSDPFNRQVSVVHPDNPMGVPTNKLIIRKDWCFETEDYFDSGEQDLRVMGRFGVIPLADFTEEV